jgi:16S rRNA (uracil1498-N3)-methyltransferase
MSSRFYSANAIDGPTLVLSGDEARHLIHVHRAKAGDEVVLFDGGGAEFAAQVTLVRRAEVELAILSRRAVDRELPFELVLGTALPKQDRQHGLVEKAVELGVARFVPLLTERGVARPGRQALDRFGRYVIEASKQCGRNRLMQIDEPRPLVDFVQQAPRHAARLLAHPSAAGNAPAAQEETATVARSVASAAGADRPVYLAVGPEGGFTDQETSTARQAGWRAVDLGPRILRVETAGLALAAAIVLGART